MKNALLLVVVLAACGGTPKPAQTTEPAAAAEPAPTEPAPTEAVATEPAPAPPPDEGVLAQAALAEQYDLGKKVYTDKKCASCHEDSGAGNKKNPPVIGTKAYPEQPAKTAKLRKGVTFKTAADVLGFVKAKMPIKEPGTLSDDEAAAVTAWMLSESKVNIEKKLDATNAAAVNLR